MSDSPAAVESDESRYTFLFARVGLAILFLVGLVSTVAAPLTLELGTLSAPQPGFWVFWVSLLTTALTAATFFRASILIDGVEPFKRTDAPVLLAVPLLLLIVPMLALFGVSITTLIVCLYWFKVITHASWRMTLIGSALITGGIWTVFIYLLGVPFNPGTIIPI